MEAAGYPERTTKRAFEEIGGEWQREGFPSVTYWRLAVGPTVVGPTLSGDSDDDEIWGGCTWELMRSRPEVRVLVPDDADPEIVLRMLKKITASIRRKGLDWGQHEHVTSGWTEQ